MKKTFFVLIAFMLTGCAQVAVPVKQEPGKTEARGHSRRQRPRGEAGKFDFYVLALSWSPGYCATPAGQRDDLQCAPQRHFAFVLHGLWPQYEKSGWPQNCPGGRLNDTQVNQMLDIMPSPKLVRHEWEKHGTCSGLSTADYLDEAREAFTKVKIPVPYQAPLQQLTVNPGDMQAEFERANPDLGADAFAVVCTNNDRFLQEVRVCLTKDLAGRACNAEVRRSACRSSAVIMRPVR